MKQRNKGAAASRHVAITHNGEIDVLASRIGIRRNKQLVTHQLGSPVKVYRINRLICGKGNHPLHIGIQGRVNHILGAVYICTDCLVGIILTGRHLLQCSRMDNIIHTFKGSSEPVFIPYIADKISHFRLIFFKFILHDKLLKLIPGVNDDFPGIIMSQHILGETLSKGTCAACYQYCFII